MILERNLTFVADGGVALRYTLRASGHPGAILVVPGIFTDRACPEHRRLAEGLGDVADVATLDVRGHGDSGGAFTYGRREPGDVASLAARLRRDYRRVGVIGFSFGGFHAALAAGRARPFDAVALVATPARLFLADHNFLTRGLLRTLPFALRRRRRFTRLSASALPPFETPAGLVSRIAPTPLLLVHGTDDWLVPPKHARQLFARAREPKQLVLVEGGLHAEYMLADDPEPLLKPLRAFFGRPFGSDAPRVD